MRGLMLVLMLFNGTQAMADRDFFVAGTGSEAAPLADMAQWRLFTDRVMGGVSAGRLSTAEVDGRACLRMQGDVSLENNGGFVQMAADLPARIQVRLADSAGLHLEVYGNGERYNVHLRTKGMAYPWQSYRAGFEAVPAWRTIRLPFARFEPYRVEQPLDVTLIRRIGLVAIGRPFAADLCVARVSLYERS